MTVRKGLRCRRVLCVLDKPGRMSRVGTVSKLSDRFQKLGQGLGEHITCKNNMLLLAKLARQLR